MRQAVVAEVVLVRIRSDLTEGDRGGGGGASTGDVEREASCDEQPGDRWRLLRGRRRRVPAVRGVRMGAEKLSGRAGGAGA